MYQRYHPISLDINCTFSVPFGTAVTYVGIWLSSVPSFCRPSSARRQRLARLVYIPAHTHLPDELLDGLVDRILLKVKLRSHPLGLVGECHAARWSGVEGAFEFDALLGLRADWLLLENEGVPEGDAGGGDTPILGPIEDFVERAREVGCEERS
jgi:hypothetical protein